jgi:hypothetical protein
VGTEGDTVSIDRFGASAPNTVQLTIFCGDFIRVETCHGTSLQGLLLKKFSYLNRIASAPGGVCLEKFGFSVDNVLAKAKQLLG